MTDFDTAKTHCVIGPPGTGKTTYVKRQVVRAVAKYGPGSGDQSPVLVASLTRTAAAEAAGRDMPLPRQAIGTLHAHAYRALHTPPVVQPDHIKQWNSQFGAFAIDPATFLKSGQSGHELVVDDLDVRGPGRWPGNILLEQHDLDRHRMASPSSSSGELINNFAEQWAIFKRDMEIIDFTDMIETAPPIPPMNPRVIFIDEAQDLSALEWSLIKTWTIHTGRILVCVGDPWQALYDWRGADPNQLLNADIPRTVLSQSYRVPKKVHAAATSWIKRISNYQPIEYKPRDCMGEVEIISASVRIPSHAIQIAAQHADEGKTVMIAVTCGYMLERTLTELRQSGLPFSNPWRRHNGRWNPLRDGSGSMLGRINALCVPATQKRLWSWSELKLFTDIIRSDGNLKRGAKAKITKMAEDHAKSGLKSFVRTSVADYLELFESSSIGVLWKAVEHAEDGSTDGLVAWLKSSMLDNKRKPFEYPLQIVEQHSGVGAVDPKIFVGTVHSFKGGQADVMILFPDLSPAATAAWREIGQPIRDSIVRTIYVGMTRAREKLYLCAAGGMRSHGAVDW